ncbi:hypothetical protein Tdes44962_MAKER05818 [Teratosphaeria destructans]|uniref:Uncharacterized protein n=1 Tax=Teratosphaeria destructans TaxID=418781 RepID=A0A9W7SJH8_9PEZI|nr:hypothetical protein Tdes44962_MAKER05818 [Teratosphaeria destructans]
MTMTLPRPSNCGTRPAYLDNLFRDNMPYGHPQTRNPHHSTSSSISTSSSSSSTCDLRLPPSNQRPLSPAFEEGNGEDDTSIRSARLNHSPRFHLRDIFHRRTPPSSTKHTPGRSDPPATETPPGHHHAFRRPSLPKLQTSFTAPARKSSLASRDKPLPRAPSPPAQEIKCHRCYYFAARHCNGWVMGGNHGDACEQCLVSLRTQSSSTGIFADGFLNSKRVSSAPRERVCP